jgi:hypothetical protein
VGYHFTVNTPVEVWISVHQRGQPALPAAWEKTKDTLLWGEDGVDVLYHRSFPAGLVVIPGHNGKEGGNYGFPHLTFVRPSATLPVGGLQITNATCDK